MEKKPLIEIKDLCISFGSQETIKNLSYTVKEGEVLGVVGESGSGKSLTSLSVMGLLHSSAKIKSGKILFHHNEKTIDLLQLKEDQMRKLRGNDIVHAVAGRDRGNHATHEQPCHGRIPIGKHREIVVIL